MCDVGGVPKLGATSISLAVAFAATALFALSATAGSTHRAGSCRPGSHWGTLRPPLARRALRLVNVRRRAAGMKPLRVSRKLRASARWKSLHMARYHYLSHSDPAPPVSRGPFQRFADCGYPWAPAGENIAEGYPSAAAVVAGWLASPEHRRNMLDPRIG
jgi:uncharacterized protein YkwD